MKIKSLICSCAVMIGLSGVAQAHEELDNDGKFTLLFGGGKYYTDSSRDLDDGKVGEIGLGYIIDKHWAIEAIYSDISGIESDITGAKVDADMYRLDALYHFDQSGHWTPYLAAGVGELSLDTKGGSDNDETILNFGGGVKYAMSKELSVRGDLRAVYGDEDSDLDTLATISFNYVFGAESAAAPAAAPLDSDGDGVLDADDRCPGTPAGVVVDTDGCPLDSDMDGVPDYLDKCPGTPTNIRVNGVGCPLMASEGVSIELEVLFDFNKAEIKPEFMANIQRVAEFMEQHPGAYAVIEGHTDITGEADYNMDLSQRRADAVRRVLIDNMGINTQRVTAKGYGEERPRATNDTREGRQLNRHVVAVLKAQVKKVMQK